MVGGWGGEVHTCMVTYDLNDPGELNKNMLLSLNNKLHTFYGNEADSNPYIDLNINAKYYDPEEFLSCFKHTVSLYQYTKLTRKKTSFNGRC